MRLRRRAPGGASRPHRTAHEDTMLRAFRAEVQGARGELLVRDVLAASGLACRHDVVLPNRINSTTQIDHLVLTGQGILVVETKRLGGHLSGHPTDDYWRQRFEGESDTTAPRMIYSPLRQNDAHCAAVYGIARDAGPGIAILSRVVMTGSADLSASLMASVVSLAGFREELARLSPPAPGSSLVRAWDLIGEAASASQGLRKGTIFSPDA